MISFISLRSKIRPARFRASALLMAVLSKFNSSILFELKSFQYNKVSVDTTDRFLFLQLIQPPDFRQHRNFGGSWQPLCQREIAYDPGNASIWRAPRLNVLGRPKFENST